MQQSLRVAGRHGVLYPLCDLTAPIRRHSLERTVPYRAFRELRSLKRAISELPKPHALVCDSLVVSDEVIHETAGSDGGSRLGGYYSSHQRTYPDLPSQE
jgi:hypothetical protein